MLYYHLWIILETFQLFQLIIVIVALVAVAVIVTVRLQDTAEVHHLVMEDSQVDDEVDDDEEDDGNCVIQMYIRNFFGNSYSTLSITFCILIIFFWYG